MTQILDIAAEMIETDQGLRRSAEKDKKVLTPQEYIR